jgi:hypothetical protein
MANMTIFLMCHGFSRHLSGAGTPEGLQGHGNSVPAIYMVDGGRLWLLDLSAIDHHAYDNL